MTICFTGLGSDTLYAKSLYLVLTGPGGGDNLLTVPDGGGFVGILPKGADGQVLTVDPTTHHVKWDNAAAGFANPMTTQDDIIIGGSGGAPTRLGKGSDSQVLTVDPTTHHLKWDTPAATLTNPMTTLDDIIVGGSSGTPTRLAKGSDGQVLTIDPTTHHVTWETDTGTTGADPSALVGLTAVNGSAVTFMRSDGAPAIDQTISPLWTALHTFLVGADMGSATIVHVADPIFADDAATRNYVQIYTALYEPMTTKDDLIVGGPGGLPARLGVGTPGQVLTVDPTTHDVVWDTPAAGAGPANPTALIGLAAVNGSAATFLRSDGAPALDQSISPIWTGNHQFNAAVNMNSHKINNVTDPAAAQDAATKHYVDAVNPMTTLDDIIVGGASGVETRLAKGSDGQVLTVDPTTHHVIWDTPGAAIGGNPTAHVGLTAVNGSAATLMRSDGAPPIDQAIVPTWTGLHTFNGGLDMGTHTINHVTDPASAQDAATKNYVDTQITGSNPMSAQDDIIVGGAAGAETRLAKGSDGQVLTVDSTTHHVKWDAPQDVSTNVTLSSDAANELTLTGQQIGIHTQSANLVFAGPTSGAAAVPTFRALVPADYPVFIASGASHAVGAVPDPGNSAGTTKYLREDATWVVPPNSGGTVTSVALAAPAEFTVSGSPVTGAGTLTFAKASQSANLVYVSPNGSSGVPTFRALAAADIPSLDALTAPAADLSINTHKLTNVTDPASAQDAATKNYVDTTSSWLVDQVFS